MNVQDDVLSTVLGALRVQTVHLGRLELRAPWGGDVEPHADLLLHLVLEGTAYLRGRNETRQLRAGDLVLIPRTYVHTLCDSETTHPGDGRFWNVEEKTSSEMPMLRRLGGSGRETVLLCAALDLTGSGRSLILAAFPRGVHLHANNGREAVPRLTSLLDAIRGEVQEPRAASDVVLRRYVELLVLQVLRAAPRTDASTWLAAVNHPGLGRALLAIHGPAERSWSLAALAREAGMSRSAFAAAFFGTVGESPIRYLTRWRLALARDALEAGDPASLEEIATRVGYSNHAAFSSAFAREFGAPPSDFRSNTRTAPTTRGSTTRE